MSTQRPTFLEWLNENARRMMVRRGMDQSLADPSRLATIDDPMAVAMQRGRADVVEQPPQKGDMIDMGPQTKEGVDKYARIIGVDDTGAAWALHKGTKARFSLNSLYQTDNPNWWIRLTPNQAKAYFGAKKVKERDVLRNLGLGPGQTPRERPADYERSSGLDDLLKGRPAA